MLSRPDQQVQVNRPRKVPDHALALQDTSSSISRMRTGPLLVTWQTASLARRPIGPLPDEEVVVVLLYAANLMPQGSVV